jgi:hypothetical protein
MPSSTIKKGGDAALPPRIVGHANDVKKGDGTVSARLDGSTTGATRGLRPFWTQSAARWRTSTRQRRYPLGIRLAKRAEAVRNRRWPVLGKLSKRCHA